MQLGAPCIVDLRVDSPLQLFGSSLNSAELCTELMDKANVACVPGDAFGVEGYVRFAFSDTEEMISEGLVAVKEALQL